VQNILLFDACITPLMHLCNVFTLFRTHGGALTAL
jgi:hypothetical protein